MNDSLCNKEYLGEDAVFQSHSNLLQELTCSQGLVLLVKPLPVATWDFVLGIVDRFL